MQENWLRGREILQKDLELCKRGEKEQALSLLDKGIAEAIHENRIRWVLILLRHATVIASSLGDYRRRTQYEERQIEYEERALPHTKEYHFAAYNLSQMLLKHGQVARAERYAQRAYKLSVTETTDADRDLVAAILKQWPNIARQP